MPVYTVHQPPLRADAPAADPNEIVFVRDGFHFWAFLLTPLWMIWRGLWLVLVGYLALVVLLDGVALMAGAPTSGLLAIGVLVSLLVGLEAGSLRRWTLARRGWSSVGVVIGDDAETAERRFFDTWPDADATPATPSPVAPTRTPRAPDVIGLFPQPGARR